MIVVARARAVNIRLTSVDELMRCSAMKKTIIPETTTVKLLRVTAGTKLNVVHGPKSKDPSPEFHKASRSKRCGESCLSCD